MNKLFFIIRFIVRQRDYMIAHLTARDMKDF